MHVATKGSSVTHVRDLIRSRRKLAKISQSELARRIDQFDGDRSDGESTDRSYISQIESGRTKWPGSRIYAIAAALDMEVMDLEVARMRDLSPDIVSIVDDAEGRPVISHDETNPSVVNKLPGIFRLVSMLGEMVVLKNYLENFGSPTDQDQAETDALVAQLDREIEIMLTKAPLELVESTDKDGKRFVGVKPKSAKEVLEWAGWNVPPQKKG